MTNAPNAADFRDVVGRICAQATKELQSVTAKVTADAAAKGALSNNRIVFLYAEALESAWERVADQVMAELRRWVGETRITRSALREIAEGELLHLIPALVEASRVQHASKQFSNQAMLQPAVDRIDALPKDLSFRLRQFDIDMDITRPPKRLTGWGGVLKWLGEHLVQILIGIVVAAIAAWLGLTT